MATKARSNASKTSPIQSLKSLNSKNVTDNLLNVGAAIVGFWGGRKVIILADEKLTMLPDSIKKYAVPGAITATGLAGSILLKNPKAKFFSIGVSAAGAITTLEKVSNKSLLGLGASTAYELPADVPASLPELEQAASLLPDMSGYDPNYEEITGASSADEDSFETL